MENNEIENSEENEEEQQDNQENELPVAEAENVEIP